jgi:hypothetical protein
VQRRSSMQPLQRPSHGEGGIQCGVRGDASDCATRRGCREFVCAAGGSDGEEMWAEAVGCALPIDASVNDCCADVDCDGSDGGVRKDGLSDDCCNGTTGAAAGAFDKTADVCGSELTRDGPYASVGVCVVKTVDVSIVGAVVLRVVLILLIGVGDAISSLVSCRCSSFISSSSRPSSIVVVVRCVIDSSRINVVVWRGGESEHGVDKFDDAGVGTRTSNSAGSSTTGPTSGTAR